MPAWPRLTIHPSEFPGRNREALLAALRRRRLPGKWLYGSPAQAQRWVAYHQGHAPSRRDAGLQALYERAFAAALDDMAPAARAAGALRLLSLGCGEGGKDAALLARARERLGPGAVLRYHPLDTSPALVLEALLHVETRCGALPASPLVADLAAEPALEAWAAGEGGGSAKPAGPGLWTAFGMLPNQDAEAFPRYLGRLPAPGDCLLVSANLAPRGLADRDWVLPQYDNAAARDWYAGALAELGLAPRALALEVRAEPVADGGAVWRVLVEARLRETTGLTLFGESLHFAAGERLAVFDSLRFTPEALERRLRDGGLAVARRWLMELCEEGIWLCRPAGH